ADREGGAAREPETARLRPAERESGGDLEPFLRQETSQETVARGSLDDESDIRCLERDPIIGLRPGDDLTPQADETEFEPWAFGGPHGRERERTAETQCDPGLAATDRTRAIRVNDETARIAARVERNRPGTDRLRQRG